VRIIRKRRFYHSERKKRTPRGGTDMRKRNSVFNRLLPGLMFAVLTVSAFCLTAYAYAGAEAGEAAADREKAAFALWALAGKPAAGDTVLTDVPEDASYSEAARFAAEGGFLETDGEGNFHPDQTVTREEFIVMLHRYAKACHYDVSLSEETNILSYDDVQDISEGHFEAFQWACGTGLIPFTATALCPKQELTEQEMELFVQLFKTEYAGGRNTDLSGGTWTQKTNTKKETYWSYVTAGGIYPGEGWHLISGKWYWFEPVNADTGDCGRAEQKQVTPDGYYVDDSCAWDGKPAGRSGAA
jgi:hypothetical protein